MRCHRLVLALVATTCLAGARPGAASASAPVGFERTAITNLAAGLDHETYVRRGPQPLVVHVARSAPGSAASLRAVLSNNAVAETGDRLERTSAICQRVRCLAAVNADFAAEGTDEPVGGFVSGGVFARTPSTSHHQLAIAADGKLSAGPMAWTGKLVALDLGELTINGVNVDRAEDALVAYTNLWGTTTSTNQFGVELVGHLVAAGPLGRLGGTSVVEFDALRDGEGNAAIPADGVVLSGHGKGADALRGFWARVGPSADHRGLLRFDTAAPAAESVGGTPVLLRDGRRWFGDDAADFVRGRHPRTIVGWTPSGEVMLVTVDGRQPGSVGVTLAEAADLIAALGATDAINLDGGGSTTFVVGGQIANQPSDTAIRRHGQVQVVHQAGPRDAVVGRVERPVVSALAFVTDPLAVPGASDPLAHLDLERLQPIAAGVTHGTDPASVPGANRPALIVPRSPAPGPSLLALAAGANAAASLALALVRTRRRPHPPPI